jgi:hypothetical protein
MSVCLEFKSVSLLPDISFRIVQDTVTAEVQTPKIQAILPSKDGSHISLFFNGDDDTEYFIDGDHNALALQLPNFIVVPLADGSGSALVNPDQVAEFANEEESNNLWLEDGGWNLETSMTFDELPDEVKAQFIKLHFADDGLEHYIRPADIRVHGDDLESFAAEYVESADYIATLLADAKPKTSFPDWITQGSCPFPRPPKR